jgi:hypothetical protein
MEGLPATPGDAFFSAARTNFSGSERMTGNFLRFNGKTGRWTLGKEDIEVDGEQALVAVSTLQHGFLRWGERPPVKVMSSIASPLPVPPEPLEGYEDGRPKTFTPQHARAFQGRFFDDDLGPFQFETASMGGVECVDSMIKAVLLRAAEESKYIFPRVRLGEDSYSRTTGKVYVPVLQITGWADSDGNLMTSGRKLAKPDPRDEDDEETIPGDEDNDPEPPRRRRRRRS